MWGYLILLESLGRTSEGFRCTPRSGRLSRRLLRAHTGSLSSLRPCPQKTPSDCRPAECLQYYWTGCTQRFRQARTASKALPKEAKNILSSFELLQNIILED